MKSVPVFQTNINNGYDIENNITHGFVIPESFQFHLTLMCSPIRLKNSLVFNISRSSTQVLNLILIESYRK